MAPVGSYESLAAAIEAGADAVYFGVEGLNMRSRSSANFTLDDLAEIVRRCHQEQVKTYLTVNTVIYDADLDYLDKIIIAAKTAGVTAIIASDIAVFNACRRHGVEIHISTQCNITNIEAVRFYAGIADVMVLARELNLDQVRAIYDAIEADDIRGPHGQRVRLEMFCHGALCMAVSGKCYLSLHQMNSSANRGACTQICRRGYEVTDLETGDKLNVDNKYIMSPKDLKTIHFLDRLVDAGVRVLKIEGRARGPEYVYTAVKCYSEALETICNGTYNAETVAHWDEEPCQNLQPRLLGRLLPGPATWRVVGQIRLVGHKDETICGQGRQMVLEARRRRVPDGRGRAVCRRRSRNHRADHRRTHHHR